MFVDEVRTERGDGLVSCGATIRWETAPHSAVEVFFTVDEDDAWRITPNPDSFRIPSAVVARHSGEQRLAGGGPICPVLRNGLRSSLAWISRWSDTNTAVPAIEGELGCVHPAAVGGAAGAFVSGGVDSTAMLIANHASYPPGHPLRTSVGIVVVGIQSHRWTSWSGMKERLAAAKRDLSWITERTGIELVAVGTNVRELNASGSFWKYEYQGAALAGVGHLFASTISNLSIASSWEIQYLGPWGSHPLLDTGYGSHTLRIWHELPEMGRLDKMRLIVSHPSILEGLNVCNKAEGGDQNCGRCEKCLRTMLTLEVMGPFERSPRFTRPGIDSRDLQQIRILERGLEGEYLELVEPLKRAGRHDLASVVTRKILQGRLLRIYGVGKMRSWGSRILPRIVRERYFGQHRIPR